VRPDHAILNTPRKVPHKNGSLQVLTGKKDHQIGEAFTLDSIVNSCDAELIAKGTSGKGPNRGAILRHGPYTLWGFGGGVPDMTPAGRDLFINTVYYAAKHGGAEVLEKRRNKTRDGLHTYLKSAGLIRTMKRYIPEELKDASKEDLVAWMAENRPYFYIDGRRLRVDPLAKSLGIPNHKRAYLERCIELLGDESRSAAAQKALKRYTGLELGATAKPWRAWFDAHRDYLYFSDCDGFRFLVDEKAKAKGIPFEKFRGWSSEEINYRSVAPAEIR
jgi:hypothetical protein